MPTNFERRRHCASTHTTTTAGQWTRGENETLGVVVCSDGHRQYKLRCATCDTTGGPLPTRILDGWGLTPSDIIWTQENRASDYAPCSYRECPVTPTEYHHFAPRNTFGADAEQWPCLPLCRDHHTMWHQRMDGYRWHRRGVAA